MLNYNNWTDWIDRFILLELIENILIIIQIITNVKINYSMYLEGNNYLQRN